MDEVVGMGYRDWIIGGIRPKYITANGIDWTNFPQVTIHCAATPDEYYTDARDEIARFSEFAANEITNTPLINGGTRVQCSRDGKIITIEEGGNIWRGAIHYPKFKEDKFSDQVIEWDLVLELEIPGTYPPYVIYIPSFKKYRNIVYFSWDLVSQEEEGGENWNRIIRTRPQTVTQDCESQDPNYPRIQFSDLNNISDEDGNLAIAYFTNPSGTRASTCSVYCTDFVDIETNQKMYIPVSSVVTDYGLYMKISTDNDGWYSISDNKNPPTSISWYGEVEGSQGELKRPYSTRMPNFMSLNNIKMENPGPSTPDSMYWMYWSMEEMPDLWSQDTVTYPKLPYTILDADNNAFREDITVIFELTVNRYKHIWLDVVEFRVEYIASDILSNQDSYDPGFYGSEIGYMLITEDRLVKLVELAGSACNIPTDGAWVEVNGIRQYWHYSHDHQEGDTGVDGFEVLTFQLQEPSTIIEIKTSTHKPPAPSNTAADNSGCKLQYVKLVYL